MKKALSFTLVICLSFITISATAATYSYTGTWQVSGSWGTMTLTQSGNRVTGTYTHQSGSVNGMVSGNVFTGTWMQTGNNRSGQLEFTMSADGMSFTVKWKYDADASWTNTSDKGTRTSALPSPAKSQDATAASGKWGLDDIEFTDTRGNKVTIPGGAKSCAIRVVEFTPGNPWTSDPRAMNPDDILGVPDYDEKQDINYLTLGAYGSIVLEFDVYIYDGPGNDIYVFEIGPDVEATKVEVSNDLVNWIYVGDADGSISGVDMHGKVPADGKYRYVRLTDRDGIKSAWPGADIDAVAGINVTPYIFSGWAEAEIEKAFELNIIPETLFGADLKKPITRAEFAAVSVKAYEAMSGIKASSMSSSPFTDTSDPEVLKAYNMGITTGVSATTFEPNTLLNREQAATMLTRVLKKALIEGWGIAADGNFTLQYTKPAPFADDADISDWAKESVYFMAANGIIQGVGNNKFAPKNTTTEEEIVGYANATREQALIIAVRMTNNLKDSPLDYTKD